MVLSRLVKSITYLSCCGAIGLTCVVCADSASANVAGNSASIKDADIENADTDVVGTISSAASFDNDDLGKAPVSFSADEVYYDKEKDTMTVMGSVEAVHAGYILNADTVSYDRKNNKLEAAGNVKLVEEDGTTMVAEYAELSGDMKSGIIKAMRVLFADNSHITASRAEKIADKGMNFTNASFSSCKACDGNSDDSLFWRLRSDEVFYNEKTREIEYQNVWLDIFGHPVMYFPYFSHPSPEVKRRTGFLIPTIESTTSLGATVKTPYYWEINPHKDITLTPMFTSDEGMVMIANYRQMFASGQLTIDGSITEDSRNNIRDNIDLKAETAINDNWRATLNIERASDETYLRKYGFDDSPWLTSKGQLEGFFGSSYASVTGYSFQELRSTITEDEPLVLPVLNYNYVGDPGENYGERIKVDLNSMSVYQGDDTDSSRLSAKATIEAPYYMPKGDIYTFSASIRGDGYVVNDVIRDDRSSWSGVTGRVHPQLAAKWRYPFIKQGKNNSQTIEPIVEAIISPNGNNSDKIPNIDSRDLEFDDTNVLGENKFSGLDRIESGNRVNYGVKWNYYDEDGKASVFVGQSYHLSKDTNLYPAESGLNKHFSDFVGRVDVSPTELLDVSYRFRMDARGMDARLQEVYLETGKESLNLALDYMFVNASNQDYTGYEDREEIGAEVNMSLAQNWYAGLRGRHDLTSDGGAVEYGGHVKYKDECVELGVDVERSYTEDRDYEEGLSVMFTVILKNLGGVSAQ